MFNTATAIDVIDNMACCPTPATNAYVRADLMQGPNAAAWVRVVAWWADATEIEQYALGAVLGICEPGNRGDEFLPVPLVADAQAVQARVLHLTETGY